MVAIIGSVAAGRAVMRAASETVKPLLLELGGKNALIAYADADPDEVAAAAVGGMNFTWCGQSCGSTSRAFVHAAIYDAVLERAAFVCTDSREQAREEAGDLIGAGLDWADIHELQAVVTGVLSARTSNDDIVVFKSNGLAAWDLAAAARVVDLLAS
jgi:betaine-aldehyde dehydrogenase